MADQVGLEAGEGRDGALTPAAHLAEADDAFIGLDLDDGADESAPVTSVRMSERRLERDSHGRRADVYDLHAGGASGRA